MDITRHANGPARPGTVEVLDPRRLLSGTMQFDGARAGTVQFNGGNFTVNETVGGIDLTIKRSSASGAAYVKLARVGGTTSPTDGVDIRGFDFGSEISFASGERSKTIRINVVSDRRAEGDETLKLALIEPRKGTIGTRSTLSIKVTDDDSLYTFGDVQVPDFANNRVPEDVGTVRVPIRRVGGLGRAATVTIRRDGGTASAGDDFTLGANTEVSFAANQALAFLNVPINDDTRFETDEVFGLAIANNSTTRTGPGPFSRAITIVDNETQPRISVRDAVLRTVNGVTVARFEVRATGRSQVPAIVRFATADGTAQAGSDYIAESGTLTFRPGENSTSVDVEIVGNTSVFETDETFFLRLSAAQFADLGDGEGIAVIGNTVDAPTVSVLDASILEGDEGKQQLRFVLRLNGQTALQTVVEYATSDGTATAADGDYDALSGSVTFLPGETQKEVVVAVNGDVKFEPNETLNLRLTSATNAQFADDTALGTINNDDDVPIISGPSAFGAEPTAPESAGFVDFIVRRSGPSSVNATVQYRTVNGTAIAGEDYTAVTGTLTFAPSEMTKTVRVAVTNDARFEATEQFTLELFNVQNASLLGPINVATIVNDDAPPTISSTPVVVTEGDSGTTNATFVVTLAGQTALPVIVSYATENGSAVAGSDYNTVAGALTFLPGETTKQVIVPIRGDTIAEDTEAFTLRLSSPANATLATPTVTGTITDNEGRPALVISDVTVGENTGSATFTVTLGGETSLPVTVNYSTANGSATSPSDFTAGSGTLTFPAGVTSRTIVIPIINDAVFEPSEQFSVNLSGPTNAILGRQTGTGTITNDDRAPTLSVSDASVVEGSSTTIATFIVSLSGATALPVTVNYAGRDNTATVSGLDYNGVAGTVSFAPGETSKAISVTVRGDTVFESNETFFVDLSGQTNSTINRGTGIGTIVNDDSSAVFSVSNSDVFENAGFATFSVTMTGTPVGTASVRYVTQNGSATAGSDFTATTGTLNFTAATPTRTVIVPIINDARYENVEQFILLLTDASGGVIGTPAGVGTIRNDDDAPVFSISDATVIEGNPGDTRTLAFTVSKGGLTDVSASVGYTTRFIGENADSGDFSAIAGTLNFAANQTSQTISVSVTEDTAFESDETFALDLRTPTNATLGRSTGTGTIVNDDIPAAVFRVSDATGNDSTNSSADDATFTVSLDRTLPVAATVRVTTIDGTALAGSDFTTVDRFVTIPAGQLSTTVVVPILGDNVAEPTETFTLSLSGATNATIADGTGVGTILDFDDAPRFSINDVSIAEGNAGTSTLTFTVTKSGATALGTSVSYATSNLTATGGGTSAFDYIATSGTLNFTAGQTSQTVSVLIVGDTAFEGNETFALNLSNAVNASISDATGVGTINNDDLPPSGFSVSDASGIDSAEFAGNATFTVSLSDVLPVAATVRIDTANGTATANADYTPIVNGLVTIPAGQRFAEVVVTVLNDNAYEANETFTLNLSAATNASISDPQGLGTIVNQDIAPTLSISTQTVRINEGNNGTTAYTFTVAKSGVTELPASVSYATRALNGSTAATPGSDFTAVSGTLTIPANQTTGTITVLVNGDTAFELDESFALDIASPTNATLGSTTTATGSIVNDDASSTGLVVSDASGREDTLGGTDATFTVSLSETQASPVTVRVTTVDVSATAGADYAAVNRIITIPANTLIARVVVDVLDDAAYELPETFRLQLSEATNANITDSFGVATLADNDSPPSFFIGNNNNFEGNPADPSPRTVAVAVTKSGSTSVASSVNYATRDISGGATAGVDYNAVSGTLNFAPGETSKTITVTLRGDTSFEPDEQFLIDLTSPTNALISDGIGTITINNDDPQPLGLSVSNASGRDEDTIGNADDLTFTVSLDAAPTQPVSVRVRTSNGTATAASDYTAVDRVINFASGVRSTTVVVPTTFDLVYELDETLTLTLSEATNASIADATGIGTIVNTDASPVFTLSYAFSEGDQVVEGDSISYRVQKSGSTEVPAVVRFRTSSGTATADADFTSIDRQLTFNPNDTELVLAVQTIDDTVVDASASERFNVSLSEPTNARLNGTASSLTGTIFDNESSISVGDVILNEGDIGTVVFSLSGARPTNTTVNYTVTTTNAEGGDATVNGTGPSSGTITIPANTLSYALPVRAASDNVYELTETYTFTLSNPSSGVAIADGTGTFTIINTSPAPVINLFSSPFLVGEGTTSNPSTANLTYSISGNSEEPATVQIRTVDGTTGGGSSPATAPGDYTPIPANTFLTFGTSGSRASISIAITPDNATVTDATFERFVVELLNPTNATISSEASRVFVTILEADGPSPALPLAIELPADLTDLVAVSGTSSAFGQPIVATLANLPTRRRVPLLGDELAAEIV